MKINTKKFLVGIGVVALIVGAIGVTYAIVKKTHPEWLNQLAEKIEVGEDTSTSSTNTPAPAHDLGNLEFNN